MCDVETSQYSASKSRQMRKNVSPYKLKPNKLLNIQNIKLSFNKFENEKHELRFSKNI